jgi:heme exporter protein C
VYATYFILRKSVQDEIKRARLSAVFNIFAFILMILLLMVMPRMVDTSLHPGKSGNPAFSKYDLDSSLRMVFYPAVVAWGMLGYWMYRWQTKVNQYKNEENEG